MKKIEKRDIMQLHTNLTINNLPIGQHPPSESLDTARSKGLLHWPSSSPRIYFEGEELMRKPRPERITLNPGPYSTRMLKHRYIMEQYMGRKLKPTELVHHINGDCLDNRIENLQMTNMSKHVTRHNIGNTRAARLTISQVREIKEKLKMDQLDWKLGIEYGVHWNTIQDIRSGKSWKHV